MDKELLAEFLLESNENMSTIEQQLMDLESNASDASLLDAIFRTIHTVKGSCGFIGLKRLEKVAHAGENVLGRMRSHGNAVTPEIISLLLDCADAVQEILDGLQENGLEPEVDHSTLIEKLHAAEALIGKDQGDVGAGDPAADSSMWLDDFPGVAEQLGRSNMKTPEQVLQAGFNELKKIDGITPPLALKILGAAKKEAANDTKRVEE
ncbi:MAG: Hpt domain-containing protein, partial [Mariprofundaceae bacterium]